MTHAPRHDDTVNGFSERVAVAITRGVGTMGTALVFAVIALVSLPSVLVTAAIVGADTFPAWTVAPGLTGLVLWVSATFIQLVLLPIIMVGQNLAARAGDARAQATSDHVDAILTKLDALAVLADQPYTITALLEEIAVNQSELDAKLAPVLDAVKRLEEREAAEVATPALDTASLDSLAGRLDALDAAQAARVPVPVVPAVDPAAPVV